MSTAYLISKRRYNEDAGMDYDTPVGVTLSKDLAELKVKTLQEEHDNKTGVIDKINAFLEIWETSDLNHLANCQEHDKLVKERIQLPRVKKQYTPEQKAVDEKLDEVSTRDNKAKQEAIANFLITIGIPKVLHNLYREDHHTFKTYNWQSDECKFHYAEIEMFE
jgi:hypothetical protein